MKILIVGAKGQVGTWLVNLANEYGFKAVGYDLPEIDMTAPVSVDEIYQKEKPELVINAAAYTAVDKAESEVELAYKVNDFGTQVLAEACEKVKIPFFHISTDYVFDGEAGMYHEKCELNPQSVYGASKLAGEISAFNACSQVIVMRCCWIFSEFGNNFLKTMVRLGKTKEQLSIVSDQHGGPTSARDVAKALLEMARKFQEGNLEFGTYHFSGKPYTNWFGFAEVIFSEAEKIGLISKVPTLKPIRSEEYPSPVKRPKDSRLDCTKINQLLPNLTNDWKSEVVRIVEVLKKEGF